MKQGSREVSSPDRLSEVRRQFEGWRKSRRRGTRIPEELWQAAAEVGREVGVSKTAVVVIPGRWQAADQPQPQAREEPRVRGQPP